MSEIEGLVPAVVQYKGMFSRSQIDQYVVAVAVNPLPAISVLNQAASDFFFTQLRPVVRTTVLL